MSRVTRIGLLHGGEGGKRSFVHDRRQMPVGQGGFHVGALKIGLPLWLGAADLEQFATTEALYVYDCGSEPKSHVVREIKALVAARPNRRLDLLALSHFDRDHICGTPHLLHAKKGLQVNTILLPYVDEEERILALGRAAAAVGGGRLDGFFVDMVVDPVATLARYSPRRIILVRPDGDGGAFDGDFDPDKDPRFDPDEKLDRESLDWMLKGTSPTRPPEFTQNVQADMKVWQVRNAALVAHDPTWSVLWKLRPHVKPADPAALVAFKAEVEKVFKWPAGSFAKHVASPAARRLMATKHRTKVATAYKLAFKDKNLTSMSLYSGPLEPDDLEALCISDFRAAHPLTKVGWLGTGDAHLKAAPDITAFKRAYGPDIDHASTFLFPHHGSIENSDPDNLVTDADRWVAAADPIHDWQHPHWLLQAAVAGKKAVFKHVRGSPLTGFDETFLLTPKDEMANANVWFGWVTEPDGGKP